MSVLINKLLLNIMILVYSLAGLVNFCHSATNLALHKPYWVSPLPSYPLTAPSSDSTSLTDGKYTFGHFWTAKSTVGWWPVRDVEILIDLEKVGNIGKITFNTVRGDYANVQYPKHIYAFVGLDREHLMFAGDMADDPENNPGLYRVKRFVLDVAGIKGRYLLLKITPADSNSVFCDEIEVLEGKDVKGKTGNLTVKKARKMADRLKWLDPYRDYLEKADTDNVSTLNHPDLAERIRKIRTELAGLGRAEDVEAVEAEILTLRAELLRKRLPGKELLVESAKPWARMPLLPPSSVVTPLGVSLLLPQGGYGHDALVVTNLSREMRLVTASLSGMAGGGPEIYLYQVPFVKSLATEFVADSLVPVEEGFTLRPGESRMVFVSARGKSWGEWKTSIDVASGGSLVSIPVICRVFPVALPDSQTLSSVNWGYLTFPLVSDRRAEAVKDLLYHHVNVVVVPPSYLKGANQAESADLMDFIRLELYLRYHHGAARFLLGLGFGTGNQSTVAGKLPFMGAEWREGFRKWYANAKLAAGRAGFSESQLYLYPYDEMGGEQIDDFVKFAAWVRKEMPKVRLYATLGEATLATKGWEKVLPYLDIAQAFNGEMFRPGSPFKGESWIYSAEGTSRSLSSYSYYRMMSWKAFLNGYKGVGFWAYADTDVNDNPDSSWDDANQEARDFAVIYPGKGASIISSRRWEAWRMGIEDYELLTMYAKSKGERVAKDLAASVLNHPENTSKADEVRRKILTELSGMENN